MIVGLPNDEVHIAVACIFPTHAVCLHVFGSTLAGRRTLYQGDAEGGGLVKQVRGFEALIITSTFTSDIQVIDQVMRVLAEKDAALAAASKKRGFRRHGYEVYLSFVEVFDDLVQVSGRPPGED